MVPLVLVQRQLVLLTSSRLQKNRVPVYWHCPLGMMKLEDSNISNPIPPYKWNSEPKAGASMDISGLYHFASLLTQFLTLLSHLYACHLSLSQLFIIKRVGFASTLKSPRYHIVKKDLNVLMDPFVPPLVLDYRPEGYKLGIKPRASHRLSLYHMNIHP